MIFLVDKFAARLQPDGHSKSLHLLISPFPERFVSGEMKQVLKLELDGPKTTNIVCAALFERLV